MLLSTTLRLFLDGIGRREEYEYYLRKFQSAPGTCFAAIVPDDAAMEESAEAIAFDLQFLLRLELVPLVVLCGAPAPAAAEVLTRALPGARQADFSDPDRIEVLLRESRAGRVPLLIVAPDRARLAVLRPLVPAVVRRIQWLRARGPYRDLQGRSVPLHLLRGSNDHTLGAADRMDESLAVAEELLEVDPTLHFCVASPLDLLAELFTVRGKGTAVRRGSVIVHAAALDQVDACRLTALLESAFGRRLARPETLALASDIYVERDYRGAALLEPHPAGRYLSKFAVGTEARGEGLAHELWSIVRREHPSLFWRSRPENPVNGWYDQQAEGRLRGPDWHIFWRGVQPEDIPSVIEYCRARRPDFEPPAAD